MRLKVNLLDKPARFLLPECQVEKILELSAEDFSALVSQPNKAYAFIAENEKAMEKAGGLFHCILALGEGQDDGVLIEADGCAFVRSGAYLSGARTLLTAAVKQAADQIVKEGTENTDNGEWFYYFDALHEETGLVVREDNGVGGMIVDELNRRPEVDVVEMNHEGFSPVFFPEYCRHLRQDEVTPAFRPLDILRLLEEFRMRHEHKSEPGDWAVRMCQAIVAGEAGFHDRNQWTRLLRQEPPALFSFQWDRGSFADNAAAWCRENGCNFRYAADGVELEVDGEWRAVDYRFNHARHTEVFPRPELAEERLGRAQLEDDGGTESWENRQQRLINELLNYLGEHHDGSELYRMLHGDMEMTHEEIESLGFDLSHCYGEQPGMSGPEL